MCVDNYGTHVKRTHKHVKNSCDARASRADVGIQVYEKIIRNSLENILVREQTEILWFQKPF